MIIFVCLYGIFQNDVITESSRACQNANGYDWAWKIPEHVTKITCLRLGLGYARRSPPAARRTWASHQALLISVIGFACFVPYLDTYVTSD